MDTVKNKKIIAYKSEHIKKIAFNLRKLIKNRVMDEWGRLGEMQKTMYVGKIKIKTIDAKLVLDRNQYRDIEDARSILYRTLENSICICPGCNQTSKDMYYNATTDGWYCTTCVQEYRNFYNREFGKNEKDLFYESFF